MLNFTYDDSLTIIDIVIKSKIKDAEYWGQIDITKDDLKVIKDKIIECLHSGYDFKTLFKQFRYAMVTYVVFLAKYYYKGDLWGMICDEVGLEKINAADQIQIGTMILSTFSLCGMDYSAANNSPRKYVDSILYQVGEPPESNLGDLFYIIKYGFMNNVEPQILIDEITSRSYGVHKPLLHFLEYSPDYRAINFILDVQDTFLSATQSSDLSGKYSEAYLEWVELDKEKGSYKNKKDEDKVEVRPYYFLDYRKNGLCVVLPRINMSEEWVESAKWNIKGDRDFKVEKIAYVQGAEGKRYVDQMIVPVKLCKFLSITFEYDDGFDLHQSSYGLKGLYSDECEVFYFNSSGRKINNSYLRAPYGYLIYPSQYKIQSSNVIRDVQSYPLITSDYKIEQITPITADARMTITTNCGDIVLLMRPQLSITLHGRKLFDSDYIESEIPLFLDIPKISLSFKGFSNTEGIEIHIGHNRISVQGLNLDKENIIDLSDAIEDDCFGINVIRVYQYGRFIKEERFCLLPKFHTNYDTSLPWPDKFFKNRIAKFSINKIKGWALCFENGNVQDLIDKYVISVPYSEGTLRGSVVSKQDNLHVLVDFELPICALKAELVSDTDISEKCELDDFLEGTPWASIAVYGEYSKNEYEIQLKSINGIEQKRQIKLNNNGSINADLSVFRDTIQNVPLPAEIVIHNNQTDEEYILIFVDEKIKFRTRPQYVYKKKILGIKNEDIDDDVHLEKFGDKNYRMPLKYECSTINSKGWRVYTFNDMDALTPGFYRLVRNNKAGDLFLFDDDFHITLEKDQFVVSRKEKDTPIDSFSVWVDQALSDLVMYRNGNKLSKLKESSSYLLRNDLQKYKGSTLTDWDILNLVSFGFMLEAKISDEHKDIISEYMCNVSRYILSGKDRYTVIKKLIEVNASDYVFHQCLNNYSLLLTEIDDDLLPNQIKELAGEVKHYYPKLSLLLLMRKDSPIRETIGDPIYRELIGQQAVIEMMNSDVSDEIKNEDRRHFLKEDGQSHVHINLTEQISGINQFYEMIDEKRSKSGKIYLDKDKIPDSGIYLSGTRYSDLFVNWYIRNHPKGGAIEAEKEKKIKDSYRSFKTNVWNNIFALQRDEQIGTYVKEYNNVLQKRTSGDPTGFSLPNFFYFEALSALLVSLDVPQKYNGIKEEARNFMVNAFEIAPYMAERDLIMAALFVYLRRKEGV
ncbi:hypothetical protein [Oribacterium sp. NK2B42]|uniref:hypothetical protein n=1 Tax=Oribacterium sp. NK2B42 TaxID=689781 RepID=UPI00040403CC|nr:hypothetical protein [Oribacterium sp. NK2B42]